MRLAWLALLWERVWPAFWPAGAVLGLFLALALFDFLPELPGLVHVAVLAGFGLALVWALAGGVREVVPPTRLEARRRLELDSGLDHRPLAAFDDELATGLGQPAVVALWRAHKQRLRDELTKLRCGWPHPGLPARDPYALRGLLLLVLVIALVAGRDEWQDRLGSALRPRIDRATAIVPPSLDLWINPPAYTSLPPVLLKSAQPAAAAPDSGQADGNVVTVPAGSNLLGQVNGGNSLPVLVIGNDEVPFAQVTSDAYKVERRVEAGDRLRVEQGGTLLGDWALELLADQVPGIEFISAPGQTARNTLRIEYEAFDDYGLSKLAAVIHRLDEPGMAPVELPLTLPGRNLRQARAQTFHDLTPHPWAGIAVEIKLTATDAIGQTGESDPIRTVLPERLFTHPVARALAELRKQLTLDPTARFPVVRALRELFSRPDHFFNDVVVALALASAEKRLIHDPDPEAIAEVQQLMWDTALRIEEGDLAIAERDLRELQEQLQRALSEGQPQSEIDRLMDELQAALDKFLEALAEQMMEQMAEGAEPSPLPPDSQLLDSRDLREMLERARELARNGARDAARDMLAQLQELLQNLRTNPFQQQLDQNQQNAWRMMDDMEGIMQRQQELLDRSYQRSQEGGESQSSQADQGKEGDGDGDGRSQSRQDAMSQEQLRRQLGELMRRLGEAIGDIPRPLGRAERAMRDAREALGGEQSGDPIDPQTRALDQLQQGMQAMAQRFMEMMANTPGQGQGPVGMEAGPGRDPLGRGMGGTGFEAIDGVEIPNQVEVQRAREILQELRRRRGQRRRPASELDYIDRLLEQF